MIVFAVYDKHNQMICAFEKEHRAIDYLKTLQACRRGYVKQMYLVEVKP